MLCLILYDRTRCLVLRLIFTLVRPVLYCLIGNVSAFLLVFDINFSALSFVVFDCYISALCLVLYFIVTLARAVLNLGLQR